ncbi:MAG: acyl-CoA dehydrogenase family protein [Acidimicrobiia bacterium]|nr:acyl-CoA dehydrogenase family protein [Acidimicrobiia bacterium]
MNEGLDQDTLEMVLDSIGMYADAKLSDQALLEFDSEDRFPEEIVRGMCGDELGVSLLFIPEAYGGMGGGSFDVYRVCELMASIDVGIATGVLATFLGSDPIVFGGTEEQQALWLSRIVDDGLLMAYGATEPEAGSDLAAMKTTAERIEDDGEVVGYRISGNKQWISNGGYADLYTILALAPDGPSWFVVDRSADGFTQGKPEDKHGIRASNTAALSLMEVEVGADRLVGGAEGLGLTQAQAVFGYTRLMVAAFGLGAGWAALDRAIPYSAERIQAGGPLSEKQGYTHKLIVPHVCRLEAARAYIEETAERLDSGEEKLNTEGAIAKYMASEAGNAAADAAIQAHGGYGYTKEYMVEKIKRDVRITTIYEGTSEIMEMTISRDRWQQHLKTRGAYYRDAATALEALHATNPECGADVAALASHALAVVMESARVHRLTRNQHLLFRLGELVSLAECAGALARRSARATDGTLSSKADRRLDDKALAAVSRVFAREAAARVGQEGVAQVLRAAEPDTFDPAALAQSVGLEQIFAAQTGMASDMDEVATSVYEAAAGH